MPPGQPSRFYRNELCALVHVESNVILERAVAQSLAAGENVIIDGTMAWKPWVSGLVTQLGDEGYSIHVVDVEASREIAAARIVHRWQQGLLAALTASAADSAAQMGGRWLPVSAVDRLFTHSRFPDGKPEIPQPESSVESFLRRPPPNQPRPPPALRLSSRSTIVSADSW